MQVRSTLTHMGTYALLLVLVTVASQRSSADGQEPLYFSLMVSSAGVLDATGIVRAVNEALEVINNDSTLLTGYKLLYTEGKALDTQCVPEIATELYHQQLHSNYTPLAVLGCGCSSATEEVARVATIPIISYSSTSSILSNRSLYPKFFRTVPSDEVLAPALAALMNYYGWRRISIVTEADDQFLQLAMFFKDTLSSERIATNFVTVSKNHSQTVEELFRNGSRIAFLNTSPAMALFFLCKARHQGIYYPEYVWITIGLPQEQWWNETEEYIYNLNCSLLDIMTVLNRSLALQPHPLTNMKPIHSFEPSDYAMDAVNMLALALDSQMKIGSNSTDLQKTIALTDFIGVTGRVQVDDNGNRLNTLTLVSQFRPFNSTKASDIIATVKEESFLYINGETNDSVWPDDRPPVINDVNVLKTEVYLFVLLVPLLGILYALTFLVLEVAFRNRKVVKLTSPKLNYLILIGALLVLTSNMIHYNGTDKEIKGIFCLVMSCGQNLGYDLCLTLPMLRTLRVVHIFRKKNLFKPLSDLQLIVICGCVLSLQCANIISFGIAIYFFGGVSKICNYENPLEVNEDGYTVRNFVLVCTFGPSFLMLPRLVISSTYRLTVLTVGAVFAYLIRQVKIHPLNDSRFMAGFISIALVVSIIAVLFFEYLIVYINIFACVWIIFAVTITFVLLSVLFLPKMYYLYKDPKGEKLFNSQFQSDKDLNSRISISTRSLGKTASSFMLQETEN